MQGKINLQLKARNSIILEATSSLGGVEVGGDLWQETWKK
jgi:tocopherol cyclase